MTAIRRGIGTILALAALVALPVGVVSAKPEFTNSCEDCKWRPRPKGTLTFI
jgi:hypothetical protein